MSRRDQKNLMKVLAIVMVLGFLVGIGLSRIGKEDEHVIASCSKYKVVQNAETEKYQADEEDGTIVYYKVYEDGRRHIVWDYTGGEHMLYELKYEY